MVDVIKTILSGDEDMSDFEEEKSTDTLAKSTKDSPTKPKSNSPEQQTSHSPKNSSYPEKNHSPTTRRDARRNSPKHRDTDSNFESQQRQYSRDNRRHSRDHHSQQKNYSPQNERRNYPPRSRSFNDQRRHADSYHREPLRNDSPRGDTRASNTNYNAMEQLKAAKTEERTQRRSSSPRGRGDNHRRHQDMERKSITIQKPKFYQKRELHILGASTLAPSKVFQPIKSDFKPLKDWRTFTLETDSTTYFRLLEAVKEFDKKNSSYLAPDGGSIQRGRERDRERDRGRERRSREPEQYSRERERGDRGKPSSRPSSNTPKLLEKRFYLIYGEEGKVKNAKTEGRWKMPRGNVEQTLKKAYNEADLVFIFFSDHIVGCARVTSAIGFHANDPLPSCQLSDIRETSLSLDSIPNFSAADLCDGKQISGQIGREICSMIGLPLEENNDSRPPRPNDSRPSRSNDTRPLGPSPRFERSPRESRNYRNCRGRPNNYWKTHDRPIDMRSVDEEIIRSLLESQKRKN